MRQPVSRTLVLRVSFLLLTILFGEAILFSQPISDRCCSRKPVYNAWSRSSAWIQNVTSGAQVAVATLYAHGGTGDWDKAYPGPMPNQDLVIWNLASPPAPNKDWAPTDLYYSDPTWDYGHLGDVFGLTIDDTGNIYVAATTIYFREYTEVARVGSVADPSLSFNEKHGVVYKIANGSGIPTQFAHLSNPNGAGLGNLTFDCVHQRFYISNFDDGLIYELDTSGKTLTTWDHGAMRSTAHDLSGAGFLLANIPASGIQTRDNQGYALLGRRPWAVHVHQGRLYYSIWSSDGISNSASGSPSAFPNQIWSIALDSTGNFVPNTLRLEVTLPVLDSSTTPWNNPVADLTFSPTGTMIIAERSMGSMVLGSHLSSIDSYARVLEFVPYLRPHITYFGMNPTYYWDWSMSALPTYQVGCSANPNIGYRANSAGGVDFDLTLGAKYQLWATGIKLHVVDGIYTDNIWGLQGFPVGGGKVENSILMDLNGTTAGRLEAENQVGDVRIPCPAAATVNTSQ